MKEQTMVNDSLVNIAKIMIPKISIALVHADDTVRQGLEKMRHNGYTSVPVLDKDEVYLGSVSEGDFLRHILSTGSTDLKFHEKYKIGDIFRKNFCYRRCTYSLPYQSLSPFLLNKTMSLLLTTEIVFAAL